MFKALLVPVDGSEPSAAAVELALQVAAEDHAALHFVYVLEIDKIAAATVPVSMNPEVIFDAARSAGEEILATAKARAQKSGLAPATRLLEGDCVEAVLKYAGDNAADLLVIGSHSRGGIARALLGSVAEGILRRSPIPVLVTHAPPAERAAPT